MFEEFKNAFNRYNNAHIQLIIINVVVFLVMAVITVFSTISKFPEIGEWLYLQVAIPAPIEAFILKPWTIITYAFMHDLSGTLHILMNMLFLYFFGRLFVEYLGSDKLVSVYVLGALAGGVSYLLVYNLIPYFIEWTPLFGMIGASAAVYAIVVATATLLPDYTFFLLFLGPVRIKYIAAFFVVGSFLSTIQSNAGGNIAHLGGALIGFVYIKQLQAGNNWGGWITVIIDWVKKLFKPRPRVKVTYRNEESSYKKTAAKQKAPSISQAEIDAILDKISDGGYESLTKEEKDKLFKASKKQ